MRMRGGSSEITGHLQAAFDVLVADRVLVAADLDGSVQRRRRERARSDKRPSVNEELSGRRGAFRPLSERQKGRFPPSLGSSPRPNYLERSGQSRGNPGFPRRS